MFGSRTKIAVKNRGGGDRGGDVGAAGASTSAGDGGRRSLCNWWVEMVLAWHGPFAQEDVERSVVRKSGQSLKILKFNFT